MSLLLFARLVPTLVGLMAVAAVGVAPGFADEPKTPHKHAKGKGETTLHSAAPTPAEQYDAPLQLNFDPLKSVILKSEPSVPYQPQVASRPQASTPPGDQPDKPHLAPLLRETSLPDSAGDRGNFFERHEFGIQLRDHF